MHFPSYCLALLLRVVAGSYPRLGDTTSSINVYIDILEPTMHIARRIAELLAEYNVLYSDRRNGFEAHIPQVSLRHGLGEGYEMGLETFSTLSGERA